MGNLIQQGDVLIFQSSEDGEINVVDGVVEMNGGLRSAVYLSLFGGNEQDDGLASSRSQYWGNALETDKDFCYRSETQSLLKSLPATSNNLKRLDSAILRDIDWLISGKYATEITNKISLPAVNKVDIVVYITLTSGGVEKYEFSENWSN